MHQSEASVEGTPLRVGQRIELSEGQAKVLFDTGAELQLEGPSILEVKGPKRRLPYPGIGGGTGRVQGKPGIYFRNTEFQVRRLGHRIQCHGCSRWFEPTGSFPGER